MHESDLQEAKRLGHEPEGVYVRWIWLSAAVLAATVVFTLALMWGLLRGYAAFEGDENVMPQQQVPMAAGVPELDANQIVEMQRLRALEADLLDSYEWVDPQAGIARIPIERAMAIAAEKGLAAINAAEAGAAAQAITTTEANAALPPADPLESEAPAAEPTRPEAPTNE